MVEEHSGHVTKFSHLVKFVNRECQELNSLFGRRIFSVNSDSTSSNKTTRSTKALYNFSVGTNTEENTKSKFWIFLLEMASINIFIVMKCIT